MAELEELKRQFEEMQRRFGEQTGMLEQARTEQREALSLAKTVIEQQAAAQRAPSTVYIPRDRKLPEFSVCRSKPGELSIEEWINSIKSAFKVMKIPKDDRIEFVKQYLKDEAKMTQWKFMLKFMLNGKEKSVDEIFDALNQTYGDKLPIGSRLKEFYDRKQMPGETIRSYAYDLQEKLSIIQSRELSRVPDVDGVLKEQLVLGLTDDSLRREMKRRVKAEKDLTFIQLMQEAITWSEEEEVQVPSNLRTSTRSCGVVHATTATESSSAPLTLESLHEAIQQIAARQEELFQMVNSKEKVKPLAN